MKSLDKTLILLCCFLFLFSCDICSPTESDNPNVVTFSQSGAAKSLEIGNIYAYRWAEDWASDGISYDVIIGDTVINNKTYAIINRNNQLLVFQRADSINVYMLNTDNLEIIIADFSLIVGDSWNGYTVSSVRTDNDFSGNGKKIELTKSLIYSGIAQDWIRLFTWPEIDNSCSDIGSVWTISLSFIEGRGIVYEKFEYPTSSGWCNDFFGDEYFEYFELWACRINGIDYNDDDHLFDDFDYNDYPLLNN